MDAIAFPVNKDFSSMTVEFALWLMVQVSKDVSNTNLKLNVRYVDHKITFCQPTNNVTVLNTTRSTLELSN